MSPAAGPIRACKQGDTHMAMTGPQHHAGDSARSARDRDRPGVRRYRPLGRIGTVRLLRLLAWAVCCAGDLAAFTAASVYAYRAGGAGLVGVLGLVKGVPAGLLVPLVTSWSDPGAPRAAADRLGGPPGAAAGRGRGRDGPRWPRLPGCGAGGAGWRPGQCVPPGTSGPAALAGQHPGRVGRREHGGQRAASAATVSCPALAAGLLAAG